MAEITFLILADPHAHQLDSVGSTAPSKLSCHPNRSQPNENPIFGAIKSIKEEGLQVDFVICPGDLGERNDAVAAQWTWQTLNRLKNELGAKELFGTVGNHDLGSRRRRDSNPPEAHLKNLSP